MKILLADPDPAFSQQFAHLVREQGSEVRLVASARECFSALAAYRPDVAVANRDLPADGPRDLTSLLTDGPLSSIPMILLVDAGMGRVTVAGDVAAVTLQRPVRPERLVMLCESVRRISERSSPKLGRGVGTSLAWRGTWNRGFQTARE